MPKIKIDGGHKLSGVINISGAKNSAVALIPASILCDEEVDISNVPNISDVDALESILIHLNADIKRTGEHISVNCKNVINNKITEDMSVKLRASYYFMGALLSKFKSVDMYFPGGCSIGSRPINLHLEGFKLMGAKIKEEGNHFMIEAPKLHGAKIDLSFPSVGATINLMLAASKAEGETIISNAAKEPEIVNVADFLNKMGAHIDGAGTDKIIINGVKYLHSAEHEVIPDRIEAGTYLIIGALLGKNLVINNLNPEHIKPLVNKLKASGILMEVDKTSILVNTVSKKKCINIKTETYPGFPTDLQQPMAAYLTQCDGISTINETIYENRFQNLPELGKMGAEYEIKNNNRKAIIYGKRKLKGNEVIATDLRGGASVLIAALVASGTTYISDIHHILRGYEGIIDKLRNVGAKIEIN